MRDARFLDGFPESFLFKASFSQIFVQNGKHFQIPAHCDLNDNLLKILGMLQEKQIHINPKKINSLLQLFPKFEPQNKSAFAFVNSTSKCAELANTSTEVLNDHKHLGC